jgi:preprotein translocase subunit SecF
MRRKLAYLLLSGAILFGAAATMGSTITSLDTDVTYGYGKELYFKISEYTDAVYNGTKTANYQQPDDYDAVDAVATEMEGRLKAWDANGTVSKIGYDTIKVSIRAQKADATEYSYLENYLPFSGGNLTVTAGCSDSTIQKKADDAYLGKEYTDNAMFADQTAAITYVNNIPVVTIPVNYPGKDKEMDNLISFCTNNTTKADSSKSTAATNCFLVIWANRQTTDNYADASSSSSKDYDSNMSKRLIFGENASNAWYDDKNNDNDYKRLQLVPNSEALTENGYDSSKADAAYKAAKYYVNILNAKSYHTILGEKGVDVSFSYANDIPASVEELVSAGDWHLSPAMSMTMIASLVILAFATVILALYYRLGAVAILSNVAVSIVGTMLLMVYFSTQFGIGALFGLLLAALSTGFGGVYYFAKVKEELYSGRSPKKAHQEAIKKALWPTIDSGIASIIVGLCVYGLLPDVMGKLGLALVFGGAIGAISNILVLRLEGWLLANDNTVETQLGRSYGVDESKLVDPLKEEKQSYFGPYADKDFQKAKKPVLIVASLLAIASIAGVSVFTATQGTAYNYASTYSDTTSITLEYWTKKGTNANKLVNTTQVKDDFLAKYSLTVDGKAKTLDAFAGDIVSSTGEVYDSDGKVTYTVYYYEVPLTQALDIKAENYNISSNFGSIVVNYPTLSEALSSGSSNFDSSLHASADVVSVKEGTPTLGSVYLAVGISLVSLLVYFMIRYRSSRGIAATLVAGVSGLAVAGFFALTRLAVTPLVSMGIIATTFLSYILAIFILSKEKELTKESRERDKSSLDFKAQMLSDANRQGAGDLVLFSLIASVAFIIEAGILPSVWRLDSLGSLFGFIIALILVLCLMAPMAIVFDKLLSQIHLSFKPLKKDTPTTPGNPTRKKGAEPEEAIFIGIND